MPEMPDNVILSVKNLKKHFPIRKGFLRRSSGAVKAVNGVDFFIPSGETLGLVGESGCGKTTLGRVIVRALEPTAGQILFRTSQGVIDLAGLGKSELKNVRSHIQMIFQDPYSSLNQRMTILDIISEPLINFGHTRKECEERVSELLDMVGLNPRYMQRYPHSFSGGQRQRIGIARALALNPSLVVADEPVSALDVSVQAQVLNLLMDLQKQMQLTYLFISHDLSVVRYICDRVAVMYVGYIVEMAGTDQLYSKPRHPYTSTLLSAVPEASPHIPWNYSVLSGEVADPAADRQGCAFAPRCQYASDICSQEIPSLHDVSLPGEDGHYVACHFADKIELEGVS